MTTLSWDEFDGALADALASLPDGGRLIISSTDTEEYYVQCALDAGAPLLLEAVSDEFLPQALRYGSEGAAALTAQGWQAPRDTPGNWWVEIAWPGTSAELAAGARRMSAALRDVFAVSDPTHLMYSAWCGPGRSALEFPGLGIEQVEEI